MCQHHPWLNRKVGDTEKQGLGELPTFTKCYTVQIPTLQEPRLNGSGLEEKESRARWTVTAFPRQDGQLLMASGADQGYLGLPSHHLPKFAFP